MAATFEAIRKLSLPKRKPPRAKVQPHAASHKFRQPYTRTTLADIDAMLRVARRSQRDAVKQAARNGERRPPQTPGPLALLPAPSEPAAGPFNAAGSIAALDCDAAGGPGAGADAATTAPQQLDGIAAQASGCACVVAESAVPQECHACRTLSTATEPTKRCCHKCNRLQVE